jgi:hypothetical protein
MRGSSLRVRATVVHRWSLRRRSQTARPTGVTKPAAALGKGLCLALPLEIPMYGVAGREGTAGHPTMELSDPVARRSAVNPFVEHHQQSIRFQYSCFDRMLLNAVVQPMQRPALNVGYLDKCKHLPLITRPTFGRFLRTTTASLSSWPGAMTFRS